MGAIFSRWRKKVSTEDVLQELQKKIEVLEESKKISVEKQRRLIGSLILYSVLLYVGAALLFYFYYLPEALGDRLLYASPLAAFPVLVWLTKRFLHWYFVKRIAKNEAALQQLTNQRKTILEEVMEKETYKKAKEILEKYDPERLKTVEGPTTSTPIQSPDGQELRQRNVPKGATQATPAHGPQGQGGPNVPLATPTGPPRVQNMMPPSTIPSTGQRHSNRMSYATPRLPPPGPPMPRPVLPRERTMTDKLIEYLLGDGPQNRYALICGECRSHNGMALKEEFEYLSFRCCYCFAVNPARKHRPHAPKLEPPLPKPDSTQSHEEDMETETTAKTENEARDQNKLSDTGEDSATDTDKKEK